MNRQACAWCTLPPLPYPQNRSIALAAHKQVAAPAACVGGVPGRLVQSVTRAPARAWAALALQVESKAHVQKRRRENQHEFLYTLPVIPKAGEKLELYYNPDLTPLRGRPEIYVRGSFNRYSRAAAAAVSLVTDPTFSLSSI